MHHLLRHCATATTPSRTRLDNGKDSIRRGRGFESGEGHGQGFLVATPIGEKPSGCRMRTATASALLSGVKVGGDLRRQDSAPDTGLRTDRWVKVP